MGLSLWQRISMIARCGCLRARSPRPDVPVALRMRGKRLCHSNRSVNGSNGNDITPGETSQQRSGKKLVLVLLWMTSFKVQSCFRHEIETEAGTGHAKATTIKEALARWEEKNGQKASEAKEVKLYGQIPPVEKMDESLSTLVNCEKLSLSTNCIERIANLSNLKHTAVYSRAVLSLHLQQSLATTCGVYGVSVATWLELSLVFPLAIVPCVSNHYAYKGKTRSEAVGETLEELWISYNFIEKLRGIRVMKKLKVLYMSNNLVKDWAEFVRLAELPLLEDLVFVGNPLQEKYASDQNSWIDEAAKRVPKLKKLDGTLLIKEEEEEEGAN
ncbi:Dnal1 [Columba guinea]|nr:Dnal1 [Columba guinea]